MTTITQVISTAPTAPSWQRPNDFPEEADAFVLHISGMDTELNTWAGQVNTVADEINTIASTTIPALVSYAETAASTALLTANTTIYNSSTTYQAGATVFDSADNYSLYTSVQSNNTGHTPSSDDGTWWKPTLTILNVSGELNSSLAVKFHDYGTISDGTLAINYTDGNHIKATAGANITSITMSNFAASGTLGSMLLECVAFGDYTITFPSWNWIKDDLTTTTAFADLGLTLPTGVCFIQIWSRDGGSTMYAKVM